MTPYRRPHPGLMNVHPVGMALLLDLKDGAASQQGMQTDLPPRSQSSFASYSQDDGECTDHGDC